MVVNQLRSVLLRSGSNGVVNHCLWRQGALTNGGRYLVKGAFTSITKEGEEIPILKSCINNKYIISNNNGYQMNQSKSILNGGMYPRVMTNTVMVNQTSLFNSNNNNQIQVRFASSSSKKMASNTISYIYFGVVLVGFISMMVYIFDDMIFEQLFYTQSIDLIFDNPDIQAIFGDSVKASSFRRVRDQQDNTGTPTIYRPKVNKPDPNAPAVVKIQFRIQGAHGVGQVLCKSNRLNVINPEITYIRVKYGMKTIMVVDTQKKPIQSKSLVNKFFSFFSATSLDSGNKENEDDQD